MNNIHAGLLAGLVLAFVFVVYMLVRGRTLITFFKGQDESANGLSDKALFFLLMIGFIAMGLMFGVLSGLVYTWIGSRIYFSLLAMGLAVIFSLLALVSKQPLIPDKIGWNLAVGCILGLLVPLLAA